MQSGSSPKVHALGLFFWSRAYQLPLAPPPPELPPPPEKLLEPPLEEEEEPEPKEWVPAEEKVLAI